MELTLFEFHLDDASFTANAPFSSRAAGESDSDADVTDVEVEGEEESGPSTVAFLAGLAFMVALGVALRRLLREEAEPLEEAETEPIAA